MRDPLFRRVGRSALARVVANPRQLASANSAELCVWFLDEERAACRDATRASAGDAPAAAFSNRGPGYDLLTESPAG